MDFLDDLRLSANKMHETKEPLAVFDESLAFSAEDDMAAAELSRLRIDVAANVSAWIEVDDESLDTGETLADRLDALMIGLVDSDKDGELDEEELDVLDIAYNVLAEILSNKGVSDEDIDLLINGGDEEAANSIHELLVNTAPNGVDEDLDDINASAFEFDQDSDAAVMDATYKRVVAIRNGKKTIVRKRIAGRVRLSAKQKMAIKKAQRKANSGAARMRRMKSMRKRMQMFKKRVKG